MCVKVIVVIFVKAEMLIGAGMESKNRSGKKNGCDCHLKICGIYGICEFLAFLGRNEQVKVTFAFIFLYLAPTL